MQTSDTRLCTLIVEDHRIFLDALARVMSLDEGIEVVAACSSTAEAVERMEEMRVDVLVTDLEWRENPKDGIKLIHKMLALSPETKVLVCSAHDDKPTIRQAIQAGADGYLLKDEVKAADVVQAVNDLQQDRPAFSDTIMHVIAEMVQDVSEGAPVVHPLDPLTKRERDIVPKLIDGLTNPEIAECLGISVKTVKTHVSHILQKLDLSSRYQVAGYVER